jgi:hypothetical protein
MKNYRFKGSRFPVQGYFNPESPNPEPLNPEPLNLQGEKLNA